MDEGTGIVHIAPGCGAEDFELSRVHDLPVAHAGGRGGALLPRLRLAARALDRRVGRADRRRSRRARPADRGGRDRAPLPVLLALPHAAHLPHRRRLVHRRRGDPPEADRGQRHGRVDARVLRQADGGLAPEHGRLEHLPPALLRPAASVLPLRVRPPDRRRLPGRARGAGDGRARAASRSCTAPGSTTSTIRCDGVRAGGRAPDPRDRRRLARRGDRPVLDARLAEPGVDSRRLRDRRFGRALGRRPARSLLLGDLVPGRLGLRDARADPPLVLLAALHVGRARGQGAVQARPRLREDARRARARDARLLGEPHPGGGGVRADGRRRHALAVLRPAARPRPALRLRARARDQAQAPDPLELGPLPRRLRRDRGVSADLRRSRRAGPTPRGSSRSTAGSWRAPSSSSREATDALEEELTHRVIDAFELFVDDLSNWYIRRSRRRFYGDDEAAFRTLWYALVQAVRVVAPVMPFLAEHLWQKLVAEPCDDAPESVFLGRLAGGPRRPTRSSSPRWRRRGSSPSSGGGRATRPA